MHSFRIHIGYAQCWASLTRTTCETLSKHLMRSTKDAAACSFVRLACSNKEAWIHEATLAPFWAPA